MVGYHSQISSDFRLNASGLLVQFRRISFFCDGEMTVAIGRRLCPSTIPACVLVFNHFESARARGEPTLTVAALVSGPARGKLRALTPCGLAPGFDPLEIRCTCDVHQFACNKGE